MKPIIKTFFFLCLIAGLFTSCSKNEDAKPDNATLIVGVWKLSSIENYFQENGSTQRTLVNTQPINTVIEFTADGKTKTEGGSVTGTYQVSGNNLRGISTGGEVVEATITSLDKHNLVYEAVLSATEYNGKTGTHIQVFIFTR